MLEHDLTDPGGAEFTDGVFRALSHGRRRDVLRSLYRDGRTPPSNLLDRLAASESDGTELESWSPDVAALRIDLHHRHLPVLVQAGLVERQRDVVRLSRAGVHVASWLDEIVTPDTSGPN